MTSDIRTTSRGSARSAEPIDGDGHGLLARLARRLVERRRRVLLVTLAAFVVAAALGGSVAQELSQGGFEDPGSESVKTAGFLKDTFGQGEPNVVLLVEATRPGETVDSPSVSAVGQNLTAELGGQDGVLQSVSYWSLGSPPPLRSTDATKALVLARIDGTQDQVAERIKAISPRFQRDAGGIRVRVGGSAEVFRQVTTQVEDDLKRAEMLALPLTLLLLVLVFGSGVAASLPLAIGVLAIVGTFVALRVVNAFTEVSIFSLNLTTALGLGLAIDYSLFMVSRYREELRRGLEPHAAVIRTVQTAGRTVLFSALTVAVSLAALVIFPLAFLRSFAYAGVAVVAMAAAGALIVLPAMLAALGRRVDKLAVFRREPKPVGEGFWHRVAVTVMRRPVPIATAAVVLLLVLGAPFLHIDFGLPDDRVLPASASSRQVSDELRRSFSAQESNPTTVLARGVDPVARAEDVTDYAERLSQLRHVARVDAATGSFAGGRQVSPATPLSARFTRSDNTYLSVVPDVEPMSPEGEQLVHDIRDLDRPFPVSVGGASARLVDEKSSVFGLLPWAALIVAATTFVLLFLSFGSVVVPIKALVLNVLSLSATFGALVFVFQDGHLADTLNFTATGTLSLDMPILLFCVAFGLSMDYEVFLLSRIKEEYERTGHNEHAVAVGLEHTGRIVTAAAALLAVVFLAFATSEITFIKVFGLGLTVAVVLDATVIRATLVPAFMRLAGRANWWAPAPLRRLHDRLGIHHAHDDDLPLEDLAPELSRVGP